MPVGDAVVSSLDRYRFFALRLSGANLGKGLGKSFRRLRERYAVLRAPRSGKARLHSRKVEVERAREHWVWGIGLAPKPLCFRIGFHQSDAVRIAARRAEIGDRVFVDGKESASCTIFRRHIRHGGAVLDRKRVEAVAVIFDEFGDHALLSQHLRDG